MQENYLNSVKKQFEYYKILGEKTISQLGEEDMFWKYNNESNSIAIIINHLWGNMLSRWTDFLTTDGEKEWRERDEEFEVTPISKVTLINKWNEGWKCLFDALESINTSNFNTEIFIRNQSHSISDAINRQMMHYAYHVGQIVFIGKMLKDQNWKSLSIPKGDSKKYNLGKISKGKHGGFFTDEIK